MNVILNNFVDTKIDEEICCDLQKYFDTILQKSTEIPLQLLKSYLKQRKGRDSINGKTSY